MTFDTLFTSPPAITRYSGLDISRKKAGITMAPSSARDEQSISPPDARNDSPLSDESLAVRKRRIKAHRKSRGGCLMCKTRKVKVITLPRRADSGHCR